VTDVERPFDPDWCVAPAATLADYLAEQRMPPEALARAAGRGESDVKALLLIREVLDRKPLGEAHAEVLERGTSAPAAFWLRHEHLYRDALAAGKTDTTHVRRGDHA
jgi:hypothetical protein